MKEKRKIRTGTVVSDKMDKTVVVLVESLRRHTLYKKVVRDISKFKVHDATNSCKVGDVVRIVETRPLSKDKRWRVVEVIGRKEVAEKEPEETDVI
jgi:small subunit ribosomal protein S17